MRTSLFDPFMEIDLPLNDRRDGKVRASWAVGDRQRLIVTTDRLSAFDRVLAGVPYKGQVLNQLSAWWFERTADIVANHVISVPDPNALLAHAARPLPVEVVVRGHITGVTDTSLWGMYESGARSMYGYELPDGLTKNTPLPRHIVPVRIVDNAHQAHIRRAGHRRRRRDGRRRRRQDRHDRRRQRRHRIPIAHHHRQKEP